MEEIQVSSGKKSVGGQTKQHAKNTINALKENWKILALVTFIYFVIALINSWPVTANITNTVAGTGGDPYQTLFNIWWVGHSVYITHQSIWHTTLLFWPVGAPQGASLVYQTMMPIASLFAFPFSAISLVFSYNLLFFMGFVLSGLTMYILAKYITKNTLAAFLAGLIFTFSAFHIAQAYGHLDYANLEWVPLAIYFFIRVIKEEHKYANAIALSVSMILVMFWSGVDIGVMTLFAMILIFVVYLVPKDGRALVLKKKFFMSVFLFIIVTLILGSWAFIPIVKTLSSQGGSSTLNTLNSIQNNEIWSDSPLSFFVPGYDNGIFHGVSLSYASIYNGDVGETTSYITYTVLALSIIGIWKDRRRSYLWLFITIVAGWLALGPNGGLYYIYKSIPVFNIVREPGRFDLFVTLSMAILASFGFKYIDERIKSSNKNSLSKRLGVVLVIGVLFLIESNGMPLSGSFAKQITTTVQPIPQFYAAARNISGNFSVLQLPALTNASAPELYPGLDTYYVTALDKPTLGGYLTRENTTQLLSLYSIPLVAQATELEYSNNATYPEVVTQNLTNQTLLSLYSDDVAFVTLQKSAYQNTQLNELGGYLIDTFGNTIYIDNTIAAWETAPTFNKTIFKSYVAFPDDYYPVSTTWIPVTVFINGSYGTLWSPIEEDGISGLVTVFSPYPNTTNVSREFYSGNIYRVNTSVSFRGIAINGTVHLSVDTLNTQGSISQLTSFNLTNNLQDYIFNLSLISGPTGAPLFFVGQGSGYAGIENITFSRYK